jgi:stage II sporulation protein GA (sporulation sigma-E factor processing peptidase)
MVVYADGVMLLNFLVDLLLILGTNRMTGHPATVGRASVAAALGGVYSGACLLPGFRFLGNLLWRIVSLATMSGIAFGCNRSGLKRGAFLALLSMAMGGIAMGFGTGRLAAVIFGGGVLFLFCLLWGGQGLPARFADMEIRFGQKVCHGTVLRDTGNLLRDPVTGLPVIVISRRAAQRLVQLPEQGMLTYPFRLLTVRTVNGSGMMTIFHPDSVCVLQTGGWVRVDTLLGVSPEGYDGFQALVPSSLMQGSLAMTI